MGQRGCVNDPFPDQEREEQSTEGKEVIKPGTRAAGEMLTKGKKEVGSESPTKFPLESPPTQVVEETKVTGEPNVETTAVTPASQTDGGQEQSVEDPGSEATGQKVIKDPMEIVTVTSVENPSVSLAQNPAVQVIENTEDNEDGKEEAVVEDGRTLNLVLGSEKKPGEINELPSQPPSR